MASITVQTQSPQSGPLRPLNILHDLPQVADLIELCFSSTMDDDGQSYLQQMRRASRDNSFLRWAGTVVDSASLPLTGFVWEENGKIIGNASLVPHTYKGKKIALIANVATHPDYRKRGIGRALTERVMASARQKGARELWLHVRDDNPTAIKIYADLGFVERARRTTYHSTSAPLPSGTLRPAQGDASNGVTVSQPTPRDWPLQRAWLERAHPDELRWYARWDWDILGPGLWHWLYRSFVEYDVRQWAASMNGELLATVSWMFTARGANMLWAAAKPDGDAAGLRSVLEAARRDLAYHRKLTVEYPAGEMVEAIQSAGFNASRTLIWMRATA
ncbi:MAG: GNAT family N-acetyltransferase [Chloroflexi bacterium]|nr:GNAT family N-acetyltransferase [Chloroflexota bacterium]